MTVPGASSLTLCGLGSGIGHCLMLVGAKDLLSEFGNKKRNHPAGWNLNHGNRPSETDLDHKQAAEGPAARPVPLAKS